MHDNVKAGRRIDKQGMRMAVDGGSTTWGTPNVIMVPVKARGEDHVSLARRVLMRTRVVLSGQ